MGMRYNNPFILAGNMIWDAGIETLASLLLGEMTNIDDIFEDFRNHMLIPKYGMSFAVVVGFNSVFKPVLPWGWDTCFIEPAVNSHVADPLSPPLEYLTDNRSCLRINDQTIFIFRIFAVPVRCVVSDIVPLLHFSLQCAGHFAGNILRIIVIYDIRQCH